MVGGRLPIRPMRLELQAARGVEGACVSRGCLQNCTNWSLENRFNRLFVLFYVFGTVLSTQGLLVHGKLLCIWAEPYHMGCTRYTLYLLCFAAKLQETLKVCPLTIFFTDHLFCM